MSLGESLRDRKRMRKVWREASVVSVLKMLLYDITVFLVASRARARHVH